MANTPELCRFLDPNTLSREARGICTFRPSSPQDIPSGVKMGDLRQHCEPAEEALRGPFGLLVRQGSTIPHDTIGRLQKVGCNMYEPPLPQNAFPESQTTKEYHALRKAFGKFGLLHFKAGYSLDKELDLDNPLAEGVPFFPSLTAIDAFTHLAIDTILDTAQLRTARMNTSPATVMSNMLQSQGFNGNLTNIVVHIITNRIASLNRADRGEVFKFRTTGNVVSTGRGVLGQYIGETKIRILGKDKGILSVATESITQADRLKFLAKLREDSREGYEQRQERLRRDES